jgi:hypothetical protein
MFVAPSLTTLVVFGTYIGLGNVLDTENAFVVLALINSVRFTMSKFPFSVKSVAEVRVAARRLQVSVSVIKGNDIQTSIFLTNPT